MSTWGDGPYIATRQVGKASVSLICEGITTAELGQLLDLPLETIRARVPEAGPRGEVELAFTVAHVHLGAASVLIDGGMGQGECERRSPGVEAGLAVLGVQPDDITHVILTHAHWDHVNGALTDDDAPRYRNARYLIGRADLDIGRAGTHPHDLCTPKLEALERAGVLDLIDGDRAVAPGITMLDAPGETPGHHTVWIESLGQSFIHLADLFHHPSELAPGWVQEGTDRAALLRARTRLFSEAVRLDAVVVTAHGLLPGWGRVVNTANGFAVERIT